MPTSAKTSAADLEHVGANLGRAAAGALIFALPLLMTMEMWWIGFYISDARLALLLLVTVPLLVGLSHYGGFERTASLWDDLRDAFIAIAVAIAVSSLTLWLFNVITPSMPLREIVGKIALQTVPASIGALLARSELGEHPAEDSGVAERQSHYLRELFLMAVGALFLSLNVAPTEEMVLIAHKVPVERELVLVILSMVIMHAFVFAVNFRGETTPPPSSSFLQLFLRFTLTGYALVFLVSLFILWVFGRTDGNPVDEVLSIAIVLSFPGAIGAAAARLIL